MLQFTVENEVWEVIKEVKESYKYIGGINFYNKGIEFEGGVRVYWNDERKEMKTNILLTGVSCNKENLRKVRRLLKGSKVTRVDLAYDIFQGNLGVIEKFENAIREGRVVTRIKKSKIVEDLKINGEGNGKTVYIGSRESGFMMRAYDKAKEQGLDCKWERVEIVLKEGYAKYWLENKERGSNRVFRELLGGKMRVVVKERTRLKNCKLDEWYEKLLEGIPGVKVKTEKKVKRVDEIKNWLMKCCSRNFYLVVKNEMDINTGEMGFIYDLLSEGRRRYIEVES